VDEKHCVFCITKEPSNDGIPFGQTYPEVAKALKKKRHFKRSDFHFFILGGHALTALKDELSDSL